MTKENIRKKIIDEIDSCCDFVISTVGDLDEEVCKVLTSEGEELPLLVNVKSPAAQELLRSNMSDVKVSNFQPFLDIMQDNAFDMEDYRNIGVNDGMLTILAEWADSMGMVDDAARARSAVYSYD